MKLAGILLSLIISRNYALPQEMIRVPVTPNVDPSAPVDDIQEGVPEPAPIRPNTGTLPPVNPNRGTNGANSICSWSASHQQWCQTVCRTVGNQAALEYNVDCRALGLSSAPAQRSRPSANAPPAEDPALPQEVLPRPQVRQQPRPRIPAVQQRAPVQPRQPAIPPMNDIPSGDVGLNPSTPPLQRRPMLPADPMMPNTMSSPNGRMPPPRGGNPMAQGPMLNPNSQGPQIGMNSNGDPTMRMPPMPPSNGPMMPPVLQQNRPTPNPGPRTGPPPDMTQMGGLPTGPSSGLPPGPMGPGAQNPMSPNMNVPGSASPFPPGPMGPGAGNNQPMPPPDSVRPPVGNGMNGPGNVGVNPNQGPPIGGPIPNMNRQAPMSPNNGGNNGRGQRRPGPNDPILF